jgi:hypothetical protein
LPLEPFAADDIGQAADKEDYCQDQKKDIEHVSPLPTNMVFATAL